MITTTHKYLIFILLFTSVASGIAQNKFKKNDTSVRTKVLVSDTLYSNKSFVENIETINNFSLFISLFKNSGHSERIQDQGLYSIFIFDNEVINATFDEEELEELLTSEGQSRLNELFSYHIIPGSVDKHSLVTEIRKRGGEVSYRTLGGKTITFKQNGENFYIQDGESVSNIIYFDYFYNNGTIHVVDKIIQNH
ncbi:MAG TPA: fasciclin domain-containing protein [Flavobacteriaceae bacterium]|nr:fasciclin domain-containing protein [Flavobacteriaceae bacterium]